MTANDAREVMGTEISQHRIVQKLIRFHGLGED